MTNLTSQLVLLGFEPALYPFGLHPTTLEIPLRQYGTA
jgi:hypothetical protein